MKKLLQHIAYNVNVLRSNVASLIFLSFFIVLTHDNSRHSLLYSSSTQDKLCFVCASHYAAFHGAALSVTPRLNVR